MSLTLKISSLVIRTVAKPIGNYIKRQAREHDVFRRYCISFAQGLHRLDMRMRLGLLQDPAAIDRQIAREAAEAEARRKAFKTAPTVLTEEQTKAAQSLSEEERKRIEEKIKNEEKSKTERRIRPLSEAKAIDSGANFISEAFLFCVAGGLILFETFRGRRKDATRQRTLDDRLKELEEEVQGLEEERERYRELVEDFKEALDKLKVHGGTLGHKEGYLAEKVDAAASALEDEENIPPPESSQPDAGDTSKTTDKSSSTSETSSQGR